MTTYRIDPATRRVIRTHDGWTIVQIRQGLVEGTTDQYYWWNISMERTR